MSIIIQRADDYSIVHSWLMTIIIQRESDLNSENVFDFVLRHSFDRCVKRIRIDGHKRRPIMVDTFLTQMLQYLRSSAGTKDVALMGGEAKGMPSTCIYRQRVTAWV